MFRTVCMHVCLCVYWLGSHRVLPGHTHSLPTLLSSDPDGQRHRNQQVVLLDRQIAGTVVEAVVAVADLVLVRRRCVIGAGEASGAGAGAVDAASGEAEAERGLAGGLVAFKIGRASCRARVCQYV